MPKHIQDEDHRLPSMEEMFRQFLEKSPIYIFFKDEEIRAIQLSKNYEQMLGIPLEQILGKDMEELFPPDLARSMKADDQKVLKEGVPVTIQEELDGHYYTTTKFPIIREGKSPYMAGYTLDITDLKLTEKELRESENRFRSIVETSRDWIWALDLQGHHSYSNPAIKDILGYSPDEISQHNMLLLVHKDDAEKLQLIFAEHIREKKGWKGQVFRWKHKDGAYRFLESNATPIFSQEGEILGFWGSDRDITERVQAEEQRLIMEQHILQTQKLDSLGVLAAGIAHDFNNLMSGIYGYINLAREVSLDQKVSDYLGRAMTTLDRARGLTSQLLTFARGGEPIQKISPLFPFIEDTVQFALSGSSVTCRFEVASGLWPCNVDKNQIGQVIDNLVINAVQAMPDGGMIVVQAENVSLHKGDATGLGPGDYVRISIQDEGVGIPASALSRIFEPFYTTKMKGHGLGLATSYSIINRHGGVIKAESEPGRGSKFSIYLPALSQISPLQAEDSQSHEGKGTILVMDDEEVVAEVLKNMLEALGYTVIHKNEGKELLDYYTERRKTEEPVAAFFLDLTIAGGMGGAEVVQNIRELDQTVPVFVVSGYATDPIMAHPEKYGFSASLPKPFSMEELSDFLNKNL